MKEHVRNATDTLLDASPRKIANAITDKAGEVRESVARKRRVLLLKKYLKKSAYYQEKIQELIKGDDELAELFAEEMMKSMGEELSKMFGVS
jgi:predicted component of type VI protein secretion system